MTTKFTVYILILFLVISCGTKVKVINGVECESEVKIIKYRTNLFRVKGEGKLVERGNHFYIFFTESYDNNNIEAYINGKLIFNEVISTDESLGTTEKGFFYEYVKDKADVVLKIKDKDSENCFDIVLDKKYRQLFIYLNNNNWEIIYDNIYPLYE